MEASSRSMSDVERRSFGVALRTILAQKHWNGRTLAREAGLSKNTVTKLLKSEDGRDVAVSTVSRALEALGVTEEQVRAIWKHGASVEDTLDRDRLRVYAALAAMLLDPDVDPGTRRNMEAWAIGQGLLIEKQLESGGEVNVTGITRGFLESLGPEEIGRLLRRERRT